MTGRRHVQVFRIACSHFFGPAQALREPSAGIKRLAGPTDCDGVAA